MTMTISQKYNALKNLEKIYPMKRLQQDIVCPGVPFQLE